MLLQHQEVSCAQVHSPHYIISFQKQLTITIISLYNIANYKRQCVKYLLLIIHTDNLVIITLIVDTLNRSS